MWKWIRRMARCAITLYSRRNKILCLKKKLRKKKFAVWFVYASHSAKRDEKQFTARAPHNWRHVIGQRRIFVRKKKRVSKRKSYETYTHNKTARVQIQCKRNKYQHNPNCHRDKFAESRDESNWKHEKTISSRWTIKINK